MTKLTLNFLRHAHKNKDGFLTEEGKKNAREYFLKHRFILPESGIEIYSSSIKRSVDTAKILHETSPVPSTHIISNLLEEAPYTDEEISRLGIDKGKWLEVDNPSMNLPPTTLLVSRFEQLIREIAESAFEGNKQEEKIVFLVSHAPPLMLYIKDVFKEELALADGVIYAKQNGWGPRTIEGIQY